MVQFLDPGTAKILLFLDPEIVNMDKKISGSRNRRKVVISGSRNRRKGRQILYGYVDAVDRQLITMPTTCTNNDRNGGN